MARRYVFWRSPDGRPYRGTDDKFAHTEHLREYGESASVNADGAIRHEHLWFPNPMLDASIVVIDRDGAELNSSDSRNIIKAAIHDIIRDTGGKVAIPPNRFIARADQLAAEYYRKPRSQFILLGSLSMVPIPKRPIDLLDRRITPVGTREGFAFPTKLRTHAAGTPYANHIDSTEYQLVKVETTGRSVHDAAELAIEGLGILAGLWSMIATIGRRSVTYSSLSPRPVGVVLPGAIYTLHKPDGELAIDNYWFDPSFAREQKRFDPKDRFRLLEMDRRRMTNQIVRSPFRKDLEKLLVRYATALAQPDHDMAFLQMWSVLEHVTATVGGNYDGTISRATWIFSDSTRKAAKEILTALRVIRNRLVHSAASGTHRDVVVQAVKDIVDQHLVMLMKNEFKVSSIDEYAEILSLSCDRDILKKSFRHIRYAIGAIAKRSAPSADAT